MALPADRFAFSLLPGGRDRLANIEEAHVERVALCDEVAWAMTRIVNAEMTADEPSPFVVNEANRVTVFVAKAREELVRLGPR